MKVILLDTNIVLDFALKRDDFGEHAKKLFLFVNKNQVKSYITASSVTDIYYVLKKAKGHYDTLKFLKSFINFSKILGVEAKIVRHALNSQMKDFEDAIQTETAIQNNIKVIITRDKCGFEGSALEIFTPIEYIEELNKIR